MKDFKNAEKAKAINYSNMKDLKMHFLTFTAHLSFNLENI